LLLLNIIIKRELIGGLHTGTLLLGKDIIELGVGQKAKVFESLDDESLLNSIDLDLL
jgi:hypothetical protein